MISSLNYCASLQVELARLRIFTHSFTKLTSLDQTDAKSAEYLLNSIYLKLRPARLEQRWVYPRLLESMAEVLQKFPIQEIYQNLSYNEDDALLINSAFTQQADSLRALAKQLRGKKITVVLLELARYLRSIVGSGARTDENLYNEVARLFPGKELQLVMRQQLNRWAERTHDALNASAFELLSEMLSECPELHPAQDILQDLLERMEQLVYVPLVFDEGRIGVAIPVRINADFHLREVEPSFKVLGREGRETPTWLQVRPGFAEAIKRGRTRAVKLLRKRGREIEHQDFSITVDLPDLRVQRNSKAQDDQEQELIYDQGSIEYPVALALFPQHHLLKLRVPLNPEVMATGPIDDDSLEPKYQALKTVGRAQVLLTISQRRLSYDEDRAVRSFRINNDVAILENYFKAAPGHAAFWELLNRKHPKILSLKDSKWDIPLMLDDAQGQRTPPLIPTIKRHRHAISNKFKEAHTVQLQGMSGIGKTFVVAQWLLQAQESYDLIIFTSIPNYPPEERAMSEWVTGMFDDLAYTLNISWGRPELLQKFNSRPTTIGTPSELINALRESLSEMRVLWVIEHGESLLNEDFVIADARLASLVNTISYGDWENCNLLFVTNRRLEKPFNLPIHEILEGFTFEEACEYLSPNVWRFPELREEVAQILGNHPRALALLVGHAGHYSIHQAEIRDIIKSLPDEQGEIDLREVVCNKILGHVVSHLKSELPDTWWTLLLASTFLEGFSARQFERVKQALPVKINIFDFYRELTNLTRRSLLSESEGKWWIHSLVRGYAQNIFSRQYAKQFKSAHQRAGETYFPLTKDGRLIPSPSRQVKSLYADASSCATALYHFETAEYEKGQQAILGNYYEHLIPKALWWMENPKNGNNPIYGFVRAEKILRRILEVNATREEETQYPGAREVSYDINRLMGKTLYRQKRREKYEEAVFHYREAVNKGDNNSLPFLIHVLCDLSEDDSTTQHYWVEAQQLFEQISQTIFSGGNVSSAGVGAAYEKVASRYLFSGDRLMAEAIIMEAVEKEIVWDGIYLIAAEIAEADKRDADVIRWLERGLQLAPQSSRLWSSYYLLKSRLGQVDTLPEELRYYPRGIHSAALLSSRLLKEGLILPALRCLIDATKVYPDSHVLLIRYAQLLMQTGEVKEAITAYRKAIKASPWYYEPYHHLGQLYLSTGDIASALATYKAGIESSNDGTLYLAIGNYYETQGNFEKAENIYFTGISEGVNIDQLYRPLGQLYARRGDLEKAEDILLKGIATAPTHYDGYLALGQLYENRGDLEKAEDILFKGIAAQPKDHSAYFALRQLYESKGELEKAEDILLKGIAASKSNLYPALAEFYEKQGKLDKEEELLLKAISVSPGTGMNYCLLGNIYARQGNLQKAEEILLMGMLRVSQHGTIYATLGNVYKNMSRLEKAKEVLLKGISVSPKNGYNYLVLGKIYE